MSLDIRFNIANDIDNEDRFVIIIRNTEYAGTVFSFGDIEFKNVDKEEDLYLSFIPQFKILKYDGEIISSMSGHEEKLTLILEIIVNKVFELSIKNAIDVYGIKDNKEGK